MLLASIVLAAAESGAQAPAKPADADRQAIVRLQEQELPALVSGDAEKLLALYADGIVLLPPNEPAVVGTEAVRTWLRGHLQQFKFDGSTVTATADLTISGDLAFERLSFKLKLTPVAGGTPIEDSRKGIHVYQRQAGVWKLAKDVWNSDKPLPAAK